jgi:hypothetical protein
MPQFENMLLTWPTPSVTIGPNWATLATLAIEQIDLHDHTSGRGKPVPTSGLSIDADLTFNGYNAEEFRSIRFDNNDDELVLAADTDMCFVWDHNLYFRTIAGTSVQITNGGSLASVPTSNNYVQQAITVNTLVTAAIAWQHALVTTTTPITLTLDPAVGFGVGQYIIISDNTGNGENQPITVTPYAGDTINGSASSATLAGAYGQWQLIRKSATAWLLAPWAIPTYLNRASVPQAGALTTGHVLKVSGASALTYGPLDLADADAVTGILPVANLPDATWVVKGIQRISADAYGAAGSSLYHWRLSGTGSGTAWIGGANTKLIFEDDAAGGTKYFGYDPTKVADYATRGLAFQGDNALGPTSRSGGALGMFAGTGYGTGAGGAITLIAGDSGVTSGDGGDVSITAGDAAGSSTGGSVTITAGGSGAGEDGFISMGLGGSGGYEMINIGVTSVASGMNARVYLNGATDAYYADASAGDGIFIFGNATPPDVTGSIDPVLNGFLMYSESSIPTFKPAGRSAVSTPYAYTGAAAGLTGTSGARTITTTGTLGGGVLTIVCKEYALINFQGTVYKIPLFT